MDTHNTHNTHNTHMLYCFHYDPNMGFNISYDMKWSSIPSRSYNYGGLFKQNSFWDLLLNAKIIATDKTLLCISIAISLAFLKKYYLVKKNYSEIFSNFDDALQNFKGIPQSFANILPCFQFDYGNSRSQLEYGIFRSQVVSKNSRQLESDNSRQLESEKSRIQVESEKSRNQLEREKSRVYTFFVWFHFKLSLGVNNNYQIKFTNKTISKITIT